LQTVGPTLQHPPVLAIWQDKQAPIDYVVASGKGSEFSYDAGPSNVRQRRHLLSGVNGVKVAAADRQH
jgi:hypothetical protein